MVISKIFGHFHSFTPEQFVVGISEHAIYQKKQQ